LAGECILTKTVTVRYDRQWFSSEIQKEILVSNAK
jgi:hypothetical protein